MEGNSHAALVTEVPALGFASMSTVPGHQPAMLRPDPPPPVQWWSWPIRQRVGRTAAVFGGLVAAWALVRWMTGQLHLSLLAMGALALSLWRFFVPVGFELNADGVTQSLLGWQRHIPWTAIRRYEVRGAGVLLLAQADRCPIDLMRGLYLPWGEHREEVLAHVRYHLDPWPAP